MKQKRISLILTKDINCIGSFDSEVKCYKKYLKLRDGTQMKIKKRESKMNRI